MLSGEAPAAAAVAGRPTTCKEDIPFPPRSERDRSPRVLLPTGQSDLGRRFRLHYSRSPSSSDAFPVSWRIRRKAPRQILGGRGRSAATVLTFHARDAMVSQRCRFSTGLSRGFGDESSGFGQGAKQEPAGSWRARKRNLQRLAISLQRERTRSVRLCQGR